jgi:hypothetical protein
LGKGKWIVALVIIIVIIAGGIYILSQTPGFGKPKEVTLTGTVTTTGTGTTPEKITFTSVRDETIYVAAVTGGNPGTYSISLPNGDSYSVKITWKILGLVTGGDADAGTLNLDTFEESIEKNWAG